MDMEAALPSSPDHLAHSGVDPAGGSLLPGPCQQERADLLGSDSQWPTATKPTGGQGEQAGGPVCLIKSRGGAWLRLEAGGSW